MKINIYQPPPANKPPEILGGFYHQRTRCTTVSTVRKEVLDFVWFFGSKLGQQTLNSRSSSPQILLSTFKHATYGEDWTWPFHHWVCTVKSFGPIAWLVSAKMGYCTPFHPLAEKLRLSLSKLKKNRELNVPSFLNKHIKKSYKHIHYWLLFAHPVLPFNIPLKIPGQCPNPIIHGTCTSTSDCFIQHHPSSVIPILLLNIPIKTAPN